MPRFFKVKYMCYGQVGSMLLCLLFADIYNLTDVKRELFKVGHNWRSVGEALRLHPDSLSRIQADHPGDVRACLTEVLTEWLKERYDTTRFGPPSWKLLVEAVADPAGGDNCALAQKIAQRFNGK